MPKMLIHKAGTRGHANHGWLDSRHTFSFAGYHNPERMHFGVLRVLNDDIVEGGMGFSFHPHDNMEIISIPLEGDLEHRDSMGNIQVIRENDVQVMSAGTGVYHSEFNRNRDRKVNFLQTWVYPNKRDVEPRYGQATFPPEGRDNRLQQILSPDPEDEGVWIHQDAWFHMGRFEKGLSSQYSLRKDGNGVYVFVIRGEVTVNGQSLQQRDGLGLTGVMHITLVADSDCEILIMEVPMS